MGHAKDTPTECFLQLRPTDMGERLVMGWRDPAQDVTQHEKPKGREGRLEENGVTAWAQEQQLERDPE